MILVPLSVAEYFASSHQVPGNAPSEFGRYFLYTCHSPSMYLADSVVDLLSLARSHPRFQTRSTLLESRG